MNKNSRISSSPFRQVCLKCHCWLRNWSSVGTHLNLSWNLNIIPCMSVLEVLAGTMETNPHSLRVQGRRNFREWKVLGATGSFWGRERWVFLALSSGRFGTEYAGRFWTSYGFGLELRKCRGRICRKGSLTTWCLTSLMCGRLGFELLVWIRGEFLLAQEIYLWR